MGLMTTGCDLVELQLFISHNSSTHGSTLVLFVEDAFPTC
jgi:hypothetical protein